MSLRALLGLSLSLWCVGAAAMQVLSDEQMGEVSGAGVGFFIDQFYYDQGTASARVTGVKDSQGSPLQIDFERAYIKGEGSQRGAVDTEATLGTPLHPFTLGVVSGAAAPTLPAGKQALQLKTPTYSDPLNDTHQYGMWAYYQGCLYGEPGCTDPNKAVGVVQAQLDLLQGTRSALLAKYQTVGFLTLKQDIDADMVLVNQRKQVVEARTVTFQAARDTFNSTYDAAPGSYRGGLITYNKPAKGETYFCSVFGCPQAVRAYNNSIDPFNTSSTALFEAQKQLGEAWNVERYGGLTLTQRLGDYTEFSILCGAPSAQSPTCVGGSIKSTEDGKQVVTVVAATLQAGGTRVKGLDVGIEATFSLPSVAYSKDGNGNIVKGATTTRRDFFSINLEGFTLNGAYLNLWGDSAGLQGEASLQAYADKLVIGGCRNCTDGNRAVAKNLYFDINLGHASLQPLSFSVLADGELRLFLPGVTWANHQAFYQQVPKSNISVGNLNIGGVDLGSQVVRGIRVDYLNMRTVNLPR